MIRYLNILLACAAEPWALERSKLIEVRDFLLRKGVQEIEAGTSPRRDGGEKPLTAIQMAARDFDARVTQRAEQRAAASDGIPGILPIYGVLSQRMNMMQEFSGGTSTQQIASLFRAYLADPGTSSIILDFDSPGGVINGIPELAQEIYDSRGAKPIVAQVNSTAASAAYWLASQAEEIVVTPSAQAGSIGVYTIHEDVSKMLENEGIATTLISAGKYKTEGNPYGPLGEEATAAIQDRVNQGYDNFVSDVSRGRGSNITVATVNDRFGQGRMFGADELVSRRMADTVATLEQTIERFSGISFNPIASAARDARAQRAQARIDLEAKLEARDELSPRELEEALRGILGLTRSKAKDAVHAAKGSTSQREAEGKPATADIAKTIADGRRILGELKTSI